MSNACEKRDVLCTITDTGPKALTPSEAEALATHEKAINAGIKTFIEVGNALLAIRAGKLYRVQYKTFGEYVRGRWGFEASRARQLIAAAKTAQSVEISTLLNEGQAKELSRVPQVLRQAVLDSATEKADGRPLTAAAIRSAAEDVLAEIRTATSGRKPCVAYYTGNFEWYTPPVIIEAARNVMGAFDCDPASCAVANRTVRAARYYTKEQDGLAQTWGKHVWMNPPYAFPLVAKFTQALLDKLASGEVSEAIVLVNNATETGWFQQLLNAATAVCFYRGRIRFLNADGCPEGSALQGQVIFYFGSKAAVFRSGFKQFGWTVEVQKDSSAMRAVA